MAGDWIKFRCSLLRDGRVRKVSRSLTTDVTHVIGGLVTLWSLGDEQADEKGVLDGYTKDDINSLLNIENFCESLPGCWINLSGEFVQLPDYIEHNGATGKKRAQDQKRQKISRKKVESKRDKNATREEKRREEKIYTKRGVFAVPTFDQVKGYCDGRKNGIDPQNFLDSNEQKGWVVGKNKTPMKCWKAAIRTWEQFRKTNDTQSSQMKDVI